MKCNLVLSYNNCFPPSLMLWLQKGINSYFISFEEIETKSYKLLNNTDISFENIKSLRNCEIMLCNL